MFKNPFWPARGHAAQVEKGPAVPHHHRHRHRHRRHTMSNDLSSRRLRKELASLMKSPVENIEALPLETNILEWHYVITGTKGTPYE